MSKICRKTCRLRLGPLCSLLIALLLLPSCALADSSGRLVEETFRRPDAPPSVTITAPPTTSAQTEASSAQTAATTSRPSASKTEASATEFIPPRESYTEGEGDLDLEKLGKRIEQYFRDKSLDKAVVALGWRDLAGGQSFGIDADLRLEAASTIKLPACMYSYEKAAEGLCDLNENIQVEEEDLEMGGGAITSSGVGKSYSLQDVLHHAILDSDNTANRMIYRFWQERCPERWLVLALDQRYGLQYNGTKGLSPKESLAILQELYLNPNAVPGYATLIADMQNASYQGMAASFVPGAVAQKYGSLGGLRHDIGLSLDGRPFAFAVFTLNLNDPESVIGELVRIFYDFSNGLS